MNGFDFFDLVFACFMVSVGATLVAHRNPLGPIVLGLGVFLLFFRGAEP